MLKYGPHSQLKNNLIFRPNAHYKTRTMMVNELGRIPQTFTYLQTGKTRRWREKGQNQISLLANSSGTNQFELPSKKYANNRARGILLLI